MKDKYLIGLIILLWGCYNSDKEINSANKIVIDAQFLCDSIYANVDIMPKKELIVMKFCPVNNKEYNPVYDSIKSPLLNRKVKWVFYSAVPLKLQSDIELPGIVSPGDSIHIIYKNGTPSYSGNGSTKFNAWHKIVEVEETLTKPTSFSINIDSVNDYLHWSNYLDEKLQKQVTIIDSFRSKIPSFEYEYLRAKIVNSAELDRIIAFSSLQRCLHKKDSINASLYLNNIWDSTQYKPYGKWLRATSSYYGDIYGMYLFNRFEIYRKYSFNLKADSLSSREIRSYLNYTSAKKNYNGLLRERLMAYIFSDHATLKLGFKNQMIQSMLNDYYKQPAFLSTRNGLKN